MTTVERLDKFFDQMFSFLEKKNLKYGDSALNPLQIFAKQEHNGIVYRIDDKLARIKNSQELRKNDVIDLIGYLSLLAIEKNWDDLSDILE